MDRDLALLAASRALRSFVAGYVAVIIGLYLLDKGFSLPEIGAVFAVGAFSNPFLSVLFGYSGDRYGTKGSLLVALSTLVIGLTLTYLSDNFYVILLASALSGYGTVGGLIGGGIGAVAAPLFTSMISRKVRREELNRVISAFTAVSSYAGSAGTLLSGLDYSTLFLLGILLALVSTVIVIPVKEGSPGPKVANGTTREEVPEKRQRTYMRVFAVSGALNGVSQGLVVPFMPVVFKEYFGLSNAEIGRIYFVVGILTATLMLFLSSRLSEVMGVGRFIFVSRTVSALSALLIPLVKEETIAIALFVAFMTFRVLSLPSQQALIVAVIGERRRGTALGLNQGARLLPFSLASLAAGYLIPLSLVVPFLIALIATEGGSWLYYKYFADLRLSAPFSVE